MTSTAYVGRLGRAFGAVTSVAVAALSEQPRADAMRRVAEELRRCLHVEGCVFHQLDPAGISVVHGITPASDFERLPVRIMPTDVLRAAHPGVEHAVTSRGDEPVAVTDVVSLRQWRSSDFAASMRDTFGDSRQFSIPAGKTDRVHRGWVLNRDGVDYGRADREAAAALQPVLDVVARHYLASLRIGEPPAEAHGLTERELLVLRLYADGLPATTVARRLGVSARTVQKHLEHTYRKLGVRDKVSAVRVAASAGLLGRSRARSLPLGQVSLF